VQSLISLHGAAMGANLLKSSLTSSEVLSMPKTRKHPPKTHQERIKGLWIHLIVFLIVNTGLTTLNLTRNSEKLWFYWPLLGWGLGVMFHAAIVYRRRNQP
jgi:hypothetical protein